MNPTIWKQLDSRWSSKPYPIKSSSFGGNGCGCCACVHVAMEQEDKAGWTPESLRPWMIKQGYAYAGQGTSWSGITETLKYIGHKNVVCVWNDPMTEAWKELNKGNRIGIILFGAGWGGKTKGKKVYWTAGGHYIAFTDYYVKDGKHYFYMKDSGGRGNSGIFSYEDSMYGVVSKVWIVEKIGTKEPESYGGQYPKIDMSTSSRDAVIKDMMAWAEKIEATKKYRYKKYSSNKYDKMCPVCNPEIVKKSIKYRGWNCIGFQSAICYHGGIKDVTCACNGTGNDSMFDKMLNNPKTALATWKKRNGSKWTLVYNNGKKIPESMLQAGDVLIHTDPKNLKKYMHSTVKAEKGYLHHSSGGNALVSKVKYPLSSRPCVMALRPQYTKRTVREYIDKSINGGVDNVKLLQAYLNWYGNSLTVDGIWGDLTDKAVKAMQTDFFGSGQADGKIGAKTLEKMKAVKK